MAKKKRRTKPARAAAKDLTARGQKAKRVKAGAVAVRQTSDEVVVAFQASTPRAPYIVGNLWNGNDTPPTSRGT